MLGHCCGTDRGRRGQHCLKPITHWLMILSSHLATPFSHSLLLLTLHKSNVGSSTVHDPQVVRKSATTPSRVRLTVVCLCVCFPLNCCPGADFSTTSSPLLCFLSRRLFVWCQSHGVCAREVFFELGGRFIAFALLLWCKS